MLVYYFVPFIVNNPYLVYLICLTDFGGETRRKGTLEHPKLRSEDNINLF